MRERLSRRNLETREIRIETMLNKSTELVGLGGFVRWIGCCSTVVCCGCCGGSHLMVENGREEGNQVGRLDLLGLAGRQTGTTGSVLYFFPLRVLIEPNDRHGKKLRKIIQPTNGNKRSRCPLLPSHPLSSFLLPPPSSFVPRPSKYLLASYAKRLPSSPPHVAKCHSAYLSSL